MKFRYIIPVTIAILLSACNLTLAEDITPPPGYVSPTPMPTLVLVPERAPSVANGALIYAEKCAPCHGETGLGDGEQGMQLGVPVKPFGLPEVARPASPAQYFTVVTRGNIERLMPPFNSLNDQQRWDVIAYALTLHTTPEQVEQGKQLFESNCKDCSTDFFRNLANMSKLSAVEIARLIREGNDDVPAFGINLSDDGLWAVAAYLRTLSFDLTPLAQPSTPLPTPTAASVTQTPPSADGGTVAPSAKGTPIVAEQATVTSEATQVVLAEGYGNVRGSVVNQTGEDMPSDLVITIRGFEHASGPNAGAQEIFIQPATLHADGTFTLENIEMPVGRIFLAEVSYSGISLQSEFQVVEAGQNEINLSPVTLYPLGEDFSMLALEEVNIFISPSDETTYEVYTFYSFLNAGETVVIVRSGAQQEISFLQFPNGATALGYETLDQGAQLIGMDDGFAVPPSDQAYGLVAFSSLARQKKTVITQGFVLPAALVRIFVPEGMRVAGDNLVEDAPQTIQGTVYQMYTVHGVKPGGSLTFEVSGKPKGEGLSFDNPLLLGVGVLGIALIAAGGWMYWRDHSRPTDDEDNEKESGEKEEFSSSEEVLDAIIALDDLHRAKKISKEVHKKRRAELKETLKGMM
jgi:mono/diheme cytochrome c family protein